MSMIVPITDLQLPALDVYARLHEAQLAHYFEPDPGVFIAESPKAIRRALTAGYEPLSFLVEDRHLTGEAAPILALAPEVPVYTASFDVLKQLTGFGLTRGMLACLRRKVLPAAADLVGNARRIAVLEGVVNPTNVGAIIRSAAALHMDAVLLTPGCADPLYRRASRVSMGTVFQIPWTYIGDSPEDWAEHGISLLKDLGFATAAMALRTDSVDIDDPRLNSEKHLAVLLGAEGDGLCENTIKNADYTVCIPMSHQVDSLNVAAASAVAFWQLGRS